MNALQAYVKDIPIIGKPVFGIKDRVQFYYQLASFIEGGIPLHGVLYKITESYQRKKTNKHMVVILKAIMRQMSQGESFSDGLSRWVPPSEVMLIQSGERSGDLAGALRNAASTTEAQRTMVQTLIGGLIYPVLLIVVLFFLIYFFSVMVVPILTTVSPPEQWPAAARPLYTMSQFVESYWQYCLIFVIALSFLVMRSLPALKGRVRVYLDMVPPYSFYKAFQSSVILIGISALMKSGVPLVEAIEALAKKSRGYTANHLYTMLARLRAGRTVADSMDTGFLSNSAELNIRIYSELSTIHEAMERIGRQAIDESVTIIKALSTILNLVVIVSIACYLGWAYYSFMTVMRAVSNLGMGGGF